MPASFAPSNRTCQMHLPWQPSLWLIASFCFIFSVTCLWVADSAAETKDAAATIPGFTSTPRQISKVKEAKVKEALVDDRKTRAIQYDKTGSRAKIVIRDTGLYYVDALEMASLFGITEKQAMRWIKSGELALSHKGEPVAWEADKSRGALYFFAEKSDSRYTEDNIYWIERGRGLSMATVKGVEYVPVDALSTFTSSIRGEENRYALTALFDDPEADFWLWDYVIANAAGKSFVFQARGAASSGAANVTLYLKGATHVATGDDHHAVVTLNGGRIGEGTWKGTEATRLCFDIDPALLTDGENTLEVAGLLDAGVKYSIFYLDRFEVTYPRYYKADNDRLFLTGDGNPVVTVAGFTNDAIRVYDISQPRTPLRVTAVTVDGADGGYRASFRPASPESRYLVISADAVDLVADHWADTPSKLKETTNSADYLVIAPSALVPGARRLADYRSGKGLESLVVDLEDIYDEFNHGMASPYAIRDFVAYAHTNWAKSPRFVVLVGDGTYDYKNILGHGDNLMPPLLTATPSGLFAADNRLAILPGGDGLPVASVGRLPVMTLVDLNALVDKIMAYEASEGGDWERRVLMTADNADTGGAFPTDSLGLSEVVPKDAFTVENIALGAETLAAARTRLLSGLNAGAFLMNYFGHAGLDRLAQEGLLTAADVAALKNGLRLPVVTGMTCLAARFEIPGYDAIGELMVGKPDGGAIAFWSPTGLSMNEEARILAHAFFDDVFQKGQRVLGLAVLNAFSAYAALGGHAYEVDIFTLLGDPALEMRTH